MNTFFKAILFALLFTFSINSVFSQAGMVKTSVESYSRIDSLLDILEANDKWMGSVAVSDNGKTIYSRAIGYSDLKSKTKATTKTKYRIGSISKTFTSVMILKAVEEKKLKLGTTIDSYFPKVKNAKKITVSNLLNHRSGIYNFTNREDYLTWNTNPQTTEELITMISDYEPVFEPNSKGEYSNSNYILLSVILEKIYKKSYKDVLQEKIIKRIGLKDTYFGKPASTEDNEAYSYSKLGVWEKSDETDMSIPLGAGSIVSTPADLTKFSTALFGGKLISESSLKTMTTLTDNYGLGIFPTPYGDSKGFGHTGGIDGFVSFLVHLPKENLSVAICSNGNNYDNNEIALCILSSYFNDNSFSFPNYNSVQLSEIELDKYLGLYKSKDIPMTLTFSKSGNTLIVFPSGQQKAPLESNGNHIFSFAQVGAVFEFDIKKNQVILKQGGGEYLFTK